MLCDKWSFLTSQILNKSLCVESSRLRTNITNTSLCPDSRWLLSLIFNRVTVSCSSPCCNLTECLKYFIWYVFFSGWCYLFAKIRLVFHVSSFEFFSFPLRLISTLNDHWYYLCILFSKLLNDIECIMWST